jgi:hypothetical protein
VRIVTRAEWGAMYARGVRAASLPAQGVYLHHDVMDGYDTDSYAGQRRLEAIGQSRFGYGISYTFSVWPDGTVLEGHGVEREGTHTTGRAWPADLAYGRKSHNYNPTHRGIVFHGNYQTDTPTNQALEAAAWLVAHGILSRWWDRPLVGGHRDVKATACCGDLLYPWIGLINFRAAELISALREPTEPDEDDDMKRWMVRGPRGDVYVFNGEALRAANDLNYRNTLRFHGAITPNTSANPSDPNAWQVDSYFQWNQTQIDKCPKEPGVNG